MISRNSVQQFKQREASPKVVSQELGARYVVTGSVREADGQVRVAVELSDDQTARVLWSERFDRKAGEVFAIQDDIVKSRPCKFRFKTDHANANPMPRGWRRSSLGPTLAEACTARWPIAPYVPVMGRTAHSAT